MLSITETPCNKDENSFGMFPGSDFIYNSCCGQTVL